MSPPPPSHAAPASPVMPQIPRPTERPSERNRKQSLTYCQPPFLPPIKEGSSSSPEQSFSSTNIKLRRSTATRRSSNPWSFSSLYIFPTESSYPVTSPSPSSLNHYDFHQTASPGPDLPRAFGSDSEDEDFYSMENTTTTNGQLKYHGIPTADSDASLTSFYYY